MSAKFGQPVKVQITSGRWSLAAVVKVVSGDTCHLVTFTDAVDPWPTVDVPNGLIAGSLQNVAKGASVGQWQDIEVPDTVTAAIATAIDGIDGFTTTGEVNTAIATALAAFDLSEYLVAPAAGSNQSSPALATSYHPSATRTTRVNVYCDVALPSALLAAQSATVQMQAGSATNPSTVVAGPVTPTNGALNPGPLTIPVTLSYDLPADHYFQVIKAAGAGTPTITRIEYTTL